MRKVCKVKSKLTLPLHRVIKRFKAMNNTFKTCCFGTHCHEKPFVYSNEPLLPHILVFSRNYGVTTLAFQLS